MSVDIRVPVREEAAGGGAGTGRGARTVRLALERVQERSGGPAEVVSAVNVVKTSCHS